MKSIKIFWLLMFPLILEAQNWENICSPGLTLYRDPVHNIASFRKDSVQAGPDDSLDSIYRSFCTIRKILNNPNCYDIIFSSVLGNKVYKKANGTFVFFNYSGDSIFVKTHAVLLQSWKLFSLPNSAYILATITEITNDSVCGVTDDIKVITLQAKDAANQNIEHIFNNKQILLSKNYGLTCIYDLVKFPNDTTPYFLEGKSTPPIGLQDFSVAETFNYDIGDEFHYDYNASCIEGFRDDKIIKIILSKEISVTGDTLVYTWERCMHRTGGPPWYYQNFHDTITDTTVLHKLAIYPSFYMQPQEFDPDIFFSRDLHSKNGSSFNHRSKKRFHTYYYTYDNTLHCWVKFTYYSYEYYPTYEYAKGLGNTYYLRQYEVYDEPSPFIVTITNQLIYYRKGSETWGSPLAPDCESLVGIKESPIPTSLGITIFPNPVFTQAEIKVNGVKPGETAEILLFDYLGREVYRRSVEVNPFIFTRDGLSDGFYIVRVVGKSGTFNITSKILLK